MWSNWVGLKRGESISASGTSALLLMISYCRLRISLCNILLKLLSFLFNFCWFQTYRLLCLLLVITKTLFFLEPHPPCFFTLPFCLPFPWSVSFVCLHYTSMQGHSVSAQWELAISKEVFQHCFLDWNHYNLQ